MEAQVWIGLDFWRNLGSDFGSNISYDSVLRKTPVMLGMIQVFTYSYSWFLESMSTLRRPWASSCRTWISM